MSAWSGRAGVKTLSGGGEHLGHVTLSRSCHTLSVMSHYTIKYGLQSLTFDRWCLAALGERFGSLPVYESISRSAQSGRRAHSILSAGYPGSWLIAISEYVLELSTVNDLPILSPRAHSRVHPLVADDVGAGCGCVQSCVVVVSERTSTSGA